MSSIQSSASTITSFSYTARAQEVIFGAGALGRLPEIVERFGWMRLMLCATGSMRRGGHVAALEAALGGRLAAIYDGVKPHVLDTQVAAATALGAQYDIDAVIGMGGGSPIGMAKAVSAALAARRAGQPLVPVVAIPTTYAGSEMTATYGVTHTDAETPRKVTVTDPAVAPRVALYDPLLTLDLPPEMTASTGINALAHCVEAAYSITRHPLSTAAALRGARHIASALPRCFEDGGDLPARTEMLTGAYLAGVSLSTVAMGLHHGLCHVLGGSAGVPHGIANAIILPHAMRYNLDATAPQLAEVAEAMGVARPSTGSGRSDEAAGAEAAQKVYDLVGAMRLPQRLRDVGVSEDDLPALARLAAQSWAVQSNPKPIRDAAQTEAVLRAAW